MRPAVYVPRTLPDGRTLPSVLAEIVAVFCIRHTDGSEADYVLVQYYKRALPGTAVDILCPPEDRASEAERGAVRHPLIPSCEYVLLADEFDLHPPADVLFRAVVVPAIPSGRSPDIRFDRRLASRANAFEERSPFLALRPLI